MPKPNESPPAKRKWRRIALLSVVGAILLLAHGILLRALTIPIISDEPPGDAATLCMTGTELGTLHEFGFDKVTAWWRESPRRRILLLGVKWTRIGEALDIPSFDEAGRRELIKQGVPGTAVESISGQASDTWGRAHRLKTWLDDHPDAHVVLPCPRFQSGQTRFILDTVLGPDERSRVRIIAPRCPTCDETTWWRSRSSVKEFMYGWIGLIYARIEGESRAGPRDLRVAEYRALVEKTFGEAPP